MKNYKKSNRLILLTLIICGILFNNKPSYGENINKNITKRNYDSLEFLLNTENSICDMDIIVPILPIYEPINQKRLDEFLKNIKNGMADSIRVIKYDVEGQPNIKNLFFDGTTITFISDRTKAKGVSKGSIDIYKGVNIEKKEDYRSVEYILSDSKNNYVSNIFGYRKPPLPNK